jgi:hypothetical protein
MKIHAEAGGSAFDCNLSTPQLSIASMIPCRQPQLDYTVAGFSGRRRRICFKMAVEVIATHKIEAFILNVIPDRNGIEVQYRR